MRQFYLIIVLLLITGCNKSRPWPAQIVDMESFSDDQKGIIMQSVEKFNADIGVTVISQQASNGFPITFQFTTTDSTNDSRAGYTTLSGSGCTTQFYSKLFLSENANIIDLVVRHELGHCTGLVHDPDKGQIMYAIASPFTSYSSSAMTHFFSEFLTNTHLSKD